MIISWIENVFPLPDSIRDHRGIQKGQTGSRGDPVSSPGAGRRFFNFAIFILFFMVSTAFATKFAEPVAAHIFSSNKKYYIDFKPGSSVQKIVKVYHHQTKKLWSFSYPVGVDDVLFLSNNGKRVYVVRAKYVKTEDLNKPALFIFDAKGLRKTYSYRDISIPRAYYPNEMGPIGDFWRIWRGDVAIHKGYFVIPTEGKSVKRIHMT